MGAEFRMERRSDRQTDRHGATSSHIFRNFDNLTRNRTNTSFMKGSD